MTTRPLALVCALLVSAALLLSACGSSEPTSGKDDATLVLDFTPNAVHTGIYLALSRQYDEAEGVTLRVRRPSETTDSVRLLQTGRADFAILSISDLALARAKGAEITGVMALVQRPLAAVLARPSIRSPKDLEGKRAGVAGLPSDDAVLESVVRGAGGDPAKVRKTNIGFTAVPSLVSGKVSAVTAFWNAEGLAARKELPGMREFRVDRFGAPAYPELVVCALSSTIQDSPDLVGGLVTALRRGYEEVLTDPESGVEALVRRVKGTDRAQVKEELDAVSSTFRSGAQPYGFLDRGRLQAWAAWAKEFGLVEEEPDVDVLFTPRFANAPRREG